MSGFDTPLRHHLRLRNDLEFAARRTGYGETGVAPYALFGSAVLLQHGLLRDISQIGDIDVFVDHYIWEHLGGSLNWRVRCPDSDHPPYLEFNHLNGKIVHAFYAWRVDEPEVNARACRATAEEVDGWWCTRLIDIHRHKARSVANWPDDPRQVKHLAHLKAIEAHLGLPAQIGA